MRNESRKSGSGRGGEKSVAEKRYGACRLLLHLILDWRLLGYSHAEGNDPYQAITSKTKQSRYNQEMNAKAANYIRGTLLGQLSQLFAAVSGVVASIDGDDPHTVNVF